MTSRTGDLTVRTIETPTLGDRSYLAIHDGWAVAVDVQRDLDRVEDLLRGEKARLGAVLETHIHNDYLTGGLALARRHSAQYVVPAGPRLGYSATRALDGTTVSVGAMTLRAIDSPGHTDAHASYSLQVEGRSISHAFTGGSLLLGATGRSDLLGLDRAEALARQQYWSVRRMARLLGGQARIMPTHGFGSYCVAGTSTPSGETVEQQLAVNPAYLLDEEEFVADLLGKLGAYPAYYSFMGPRNCGGVEALDTPVSILGEAAVLDAQDTGVLLVDIRPRADWATGHITGSLSIDGAGALATWLGWITPIDARIALIAGSQDAAVAAVRELRRIGFDDIAGIHTTRSLGTIDPDRLTTTSVATFEQLGEEIGAGTDPLIIDTREAIEWRSGHAVGAVHVSAHDIASTFDGALPTATPWLYCGVGFRSAVAASQLERLGGLSIVIDDDVSRAQESAVPWCSGESCPDHVCTRNVTPAEVRV
jgi:glyoxylase-like metal-dependent hydrolase (beta-lactamase superfamily II)/rhodanese-related sulfurtransferase